MGTFTISIMWHFIRVFTICNTGACIMIFERKNVLYYRKVSSGKYGVPDHMPGTGWRPHFKLFITCLHAGLYMNDAIYDAC